MELLEQLTREFRYTRNRNRKHLGGPTVYYGTRACLVKGHLSNTLREGEILDHVRTMLGPQISCVCLNKNVQAARHFDRSNSGPSHVCFFGNFTGGALVLADSRRFEGTHQWHGPFDGATIEHWVEAFEGTRYSVVAFT